MGPTERLRPVLGFPAPCLRVCFRHHSGLRSAQKGIFPSVFPDSLGTHGCQDKALCSPAHLSPRSQNFVAPSALGSLHVICRKAPAHPPPHSGTLFFAHISLITSSETFPNLATGAVNLAARFLQLLLPSFTSMHLLGRYALPFLSVYHKV